MTEWTERLCDWRVKQQPPHELTVTSCHSCQSLPFSALFLSPSLFHSLHITPFPPQSVLFSPSYRSHLSLFPVSLSNLSLSRSLNLIQITAIQLNNALLARQANAISQNQKELICKFRCRGNKKYRFHKYK